MSLFKSSNSNTKLSVVDKEKARKEDEEKAKTEAIERAKEQDQKKAYDKARHKAERKAKYKVKYRFSHATIKISTPRGFRSTRHVLVESPETDEDVKRMVGSLEEVRVQLCKDVGTDPRRVVPMAEWKLTPKELRQFRQEQYRCPMMSTGISLDI